MIEKCIFVLLLSLLGLWPAVNMAQMNDRKSTNLWKSQHSGGYPL